MAAPDRSMHDLRGTIRLSAEVDCTQPYNRTKLAGKLIVITGGASGIGAGFARSWAEAGAHIVIGDIRDAAGKALVGDLRRATGSAHHHFVHCDVACWADQVALFRAAVRLSPSGGIDGVVANAGVTDVTGPLQDTGLESPRGLGGDGDGAGDGAAEALPPPPPLGVMDVNVTGVLYTTHLALFHLQRNGTRDRHLLLVSSLAGLTGIAGQALYSASKHAVVGAFRALRGTVWRQGVRVNLLCPYFIDTPILPDSAMALLAGGGAGRIEDVVDAGTRLMADESIVGRALVVGPKLRVVDDEAEGWLLLPRDKEGEGRVQAVWDCFGHDYTSVDVFVWRYVGLLNALTKIRGWAGWARDLVHSLLFRSTRRQFYRY